MRSGEVLALVGVDGNGQAELARVIVGIERPTSGSVFVDGEDVTAGGVAARRAAGLAHVPADRATTGLVTDMTIAENLALRAFDEPPLRHGLWLDADAMTELRASGSRSSGFARPGPRPPRERCPEAIRRTRPRARAGQPALVLVAEQPTRGLDPGATRFVVDQVLALRAVGGAVLYITTELLGGGAARGGPDRRDVPGRLVGLMRREHVDLARIGLMMAGALEETADTAALYGVPTS